MQPSDGIKRKAIIASGAKYTALSGILAPLLQLGLALSLAHWLPKAEFGRFAIVTIVITIASFFADFGVSGAFVHKQEKDPEQIEFLFWLQFLSGVCVLIVLLAASCFIGPIAGDDTLALQLRMASIIILGNAISLPFQMLLQRELAFRSLASIEVFSALMGLIAGILAWQWLQSRHALVVGFIANSLVRSLGCIAWGRHIWKPSLRFRLEHDGWAFRFGGQQIGDKLFGYFSSSVDQLAVGWFLGYQSLGHYSMANNLSIVPVTKLNPIITRVSMPLLAIHQNDQKELGNIYLHSISLACAITFPIMVGICAMSRPLVQAFFPHGWEGMIPIMQVLCIVAVLRCAANPISSLIIATGRTELGFKWNLFTVLIKTPIVLAAAYLGMHYLLFSLLALQTALSFLMYRMSVVPIIGNRGRDYLAAQVPAFAASSLAALGALLLERLAGLQGLPAVLLMSAVGAAIYIPLLGILDPPLRYLLPLPWKRAP